MRGHHRPGTMIVLLVLLIQASLASSQQVGNLQQLLSLTLGNQLGASNTQPPCCSVRNLQCVTSGTVKTLPLDLTTSLAKSLARFSECVCTGNRRCALAFPPAFLPDQADGVIFDVSFVIIPLKKRYTCTYTGSDSLVCQYRQSSRTTQADLLPPLPKGGVLSPLMLLAAGGALGEDMEEAMEQLSESGVPLQQLLLRPRDEPCRRCAPLLCAVEGGREGAVRLSPFPALSADDVHRERLLFHQCLKRHSVRPPTFPPSPKASGPLAPPLNLLPDNDVHLFTSAPAHTPAPTPSGPPAAPATATPSSREPTSSPEPAVSTTLTSTKAVMAETTTPVTHTTRDIDTTSESSRGSLRSSTIFPNLASLPEVITRFLTEETTASAPSRHNAVVEVSDSKEGDSDTGEGNMAVILISVTGALLLLVACVLFLLFRRRRRKKLSERMGFSAVAGPMGLLKEPHDKPLPKQHTPISKELHAKPITHDVLHKKIDADSDSDNEGTGNTSRDLPNTDDTPAERYTDFPAKALPRKLPNLPPNSVDHEDAESTYASLDESAIALPPTQIADPGMSSSGTTLRPKSSRRSSGGAVNSNPAISVYEKPVFQAPALPPHTYQTLKNSSPDSQPGASKQNPSSRSTSGRRERRRSGQTQEGRKSAPNLGQAGRRDSDRLGSGPMTAGKRLSEGRAGKDTLSTDYGGYLVPAPQPSHPRI